MLLKIKQTDMVVLSEDILPRAQAQSRQISLKQLTALIDRLSKARSDLRFAEQGRIIVETALLECALLLNAAYEEEAPKETPHIVKKAPVTKQTPASENTAPQASVPSAQNVSDTPKIALEKPEDILKNWDKILRNPNLLNFDRFKDRYSEENFIKIQKLYQMYYQKYGHYL